METTSNQANKITCLSLVSAYSFEESSLRTIWKRTDNRLFIWRCLNVLNGTTLEYSLNPNLIITKKNHVMVYKLCILQKKIVKKEATKP